MAKKKTPLASITDKLAERTKGTGDCRCDHCSFNREMARRQAEMEAEERWEEEARTEA